MIKFLQPGVLWWLPVALLALLPSVLVVHPSVPARSVKEFIALAKSKPGQLSYGTAGSGSANHLTMELFKVVTATNIVHIPYKGAGPAVQAVAAGWDLLIVDEAHERSLNIDFILGHLRRLRLRRPELKIVITSATIDTEAFAKAEVSQLLICGLEIPVCVYQTAMDALREGMGVTILSDAVTGRRSEDGQACLAALRAAGAHVLPTETVFYAMLGDATHPQFRAFTELVKQAA